MGDDPTSVALKRPWWRSGLSLLALLVVVAGLLWRVLETTVVWLSEPPSARPDLTTQLHYGTSATGLLLLLAAGAGVASMATVQFWKVLFLPRSIFHAAELQSLFGESLVGMLGLSAPPVNFAASFPVFSLKPTAPELTSPPPVPVSSKAVDYLLDSPTETVMRQIRSVADYIVLRPSGFEESLYRLAGDAARPWVQEYLQQLKMDQGIRDNRTNDLLVAVRFFLEQNLNLVQIRLRDGWRRRVRIVAVAVAGSAGLLITLLSNLEWPAKVSAVFAAVVWGGFFSWFARDLVALVERRRA